MREMADEPIEEPELRDGKLPSRASAAGFCRVFFD
jgi:hypothetical protein